MKGKYPELVFGLVGAIGTDLELVQHSLQESLRTVGYASVDVKLSDLMRELKAELLEMPPRSDPEYYQKAMTAGNAFREKMKRGDAMAALAMASIRRRREKTAKTIKTH